MSVYPYLDVIQLVKEVTHTVRLRPEVGQAMRVRSHQHGYAAENLNPHGFEALQLERVVGHQLHALGYEEGASKVKAVQDATVLDMEVSLRR